MSTTETERKIVLEAVYLKTFPLVAAYIRKMGGSLEEAKDIFHDALVAYMEKKQDIPLQYSEQSYILGIVRNLWSKRFSESSKQMPFESVSGKPFTDEDYQEASSPGLLELLTATGRKCLDLLSAFYYEKLDMESLAKRFGFSGARSATVQKFKCLEKVKETVKIKSLQYEDFME